MIYFQYGKHRTTHTSLSNYNDYITSTGEVMWVGKQREELNIRLEGKYNKQVKHFVYLGGHISENGRVDVEVRHRIQAGANAWRNVFPEN